MENHGDHRRESRHHGGRWGWWDPGGPPTSEEGLHTLRGQGGARLTSSYIPKASSNKRHRKKFLPNICLPYVPTTEDDYSPSPFLLGHNLSQEQGTSVGASYSLLVPGDRYRCLRPGSTSHAAGVAVRRVTQPWSTDSATAILPLAVTISSIRNSLRPSPSHT